VSECLWVLGCMWLRTEKDRKEEEGEKIVLEFRISVYLRTKTYFGIYCGGYTYTYGGWRKKQLKKS